MIEKLIDGIIEREGKYIAHPDDRGGPTNMGVTMATLQGYRNQPVDKSDVQNLTLEEVRQIYYSKYWIKSGFGTLSVSPFVEELLFDSAIHHGVSGATKLLQLSVGVLSDGRLGPVTKEKVNSFPANKLASALIAERVAKLGRIVTRDPSQAVFAAGWMNRIKPFIKNLSSCDPSR